MVAKKEPVPRPAPRVVERRAGTLERHIQTLIVIFIAGGVGWSVKNSLEGNDRMTRLEVITQSVQAEVKTMSGDKWTGSDAKRDRDSLYLRILDGESRLNEKLADHEARLRAAERSPGHR